MTERAIDVLTNTLDRAFGEIELECQCDWPNGSCICQPTARIVASTQLDELHKAGLAVVPAFELSTLWGFLGTVANAGGLHMHKRAEQWRKTLRRWIPDERHEDDE